MLTSVTYFSSASAPFSPADLVALLEQSRVRNTAEGITGMMIYHDANFVQVLEGPHEAVTAALARIRADVRHRNLHVELEDDIEERVFPDWSMGFRDLADGTLDEQVGFSDFFRRVQNGEDTPGAPHHMLRAFSRPST